MSVVYVSFAAAVAAQVALMVWIARIYPRTPRRIPYGTIGNRHFWYGPREVVWLTPITMLALLAWIGFIMAKVPPIGAQPLMAIPFVMMVIATPLLGFSINDKVEAARRRFDA